MTAQKHQKTATKQHPKTRKRFPLINVVLKAFFCRAQSTVVKYTPPSQVRPSWAKYSLVTLRTARMHVETACNRQTVPPFVTSRLSSSHSCRHFCGSLFGSFSQTDGRAAHFPSSQPPRRQRRSPSQSVTVGRCCRSAFPCGTCRYVGGSSRARALSTATAPVFGARRSAVRSTGKRGGGDV